jgi:hypothetical protein
MKPEPLPAQTQVPANRTPEAQRCPLCGGPNGCQMATSSGGSSEPCWCQSVEFSAQLLSSVPADKAGLACICRACAQKQSGQ